MFIGYSLSIGDNDFERAPCALFFPLERSDGSADILGGGGPVDLNCHSSSGGLVGHMQQS